MKKPEQTRTRIFSHITRSRFLHLEDALTPAAPGKPGKIRFFVGEYQRGKGSQATAYHFLDADDARPLMADLSWGKPADFADFKGSANGQQPQSRVLKIKGPKDGKFWLEIQNGPGEIIGEGAVKPAGDPEASISIALTIWEARAMALAVIEYMAAYRVATLTAAVEAHTPKVTGSMQDKKPPMAPCNPSPMPKVEGPTATDDAEALFGPEPAPSGSGSEPERTQKAEAKEPPAEVDPPVFFALANKAIAAGFPLDRIQEIIKSQVPWREKHITLQAAMAA